MQKHGLGIHHRLGALLLSLAGALPTLGYGSAPAAAPRSPLRHVQRDQPIHLQFGPDGEIVAFSIPLASSADFDQWRTQINKSFNPITLPAHRVQASSQSLTESWTFPSGTMCVAEKIKGKGGLMSFSCSKARELLRSVGTSGLEARPTT